MGVSKHTFRVSRPINQNFVAGLILFCLPGIYTALTGLGAGGGRSSSGVVANQTNAILYGMFTLFACLGGTIVNLLRPKLAMMVGSLGYPLYVGGLWYYDRTGNTWFPLFAGAMLGTLCGILVTCCNMISFAYPEEYQKGLFICMQWMIRSVGASVGAAIALGCNIDQIRPVGVPTPVFVVFIVIQCSSLLLSAVFIIDPKDVIRDDGTHLALFQPPTLKAELTAFAKCFLDKRLIILVPAIFSCEMALALVSTINGFYFNLRTRCLNNFLFQVIQFFGPGILIWILDSKLIPNRKHRGLLAAGIMGLVAVGACIGCFIWLHVVNWTSLTTAPGNDWSSTQYRGFTVVYLLFGLIYSGYQMVVEWIVSSMSNDPSLVAQYAGFMRGWASFGMCVSFVMAAQRVPQWGQATFQLTLYIMGTLGQAWVLIYYIRPTDYFHEENTIAPNYAEDKAVVDGEITQDQLDNELRKDKIAAVAGGDGYAVENANVGSAKEDGDKVGITSVDREV